jgi:hypothetical protein
VKVHDWPVQVAVPRLGATARVTLSASPSGSVSLAVTAAVTPAPATTVAVSALAAGGSPTGVTVMVTEPVSRPPLPSLTW